MIKKSGITRLDAAGVERPGFRREGLWVATQPGTPSVGPVTPQDGRDRPEQDLGVHPQVPAGGVTELQLDALLVGDVGAPAYGPQARDARADAQDLPGALAEIRHFVRDDRPRPDETHVAPEHIEDLRQLVDAELAEESTDASDPRVVPELSRPLPFAELLLVARDVVHERVFCVPDHRPELDERELDVVAPYPSLHEQDGAGRIKGDRERYEQGERQHQEGQEEAANDVEPSFQHLLDGLMADERRWRKPHDDSARGRAF